jgi:hypothetical protein
MTAPIPAQVILSQIVSMDKYALGDWGAAYQNKVSSNNGKTLTLKSSGMVKWKGFIAITYNRGTDAYDLEFYRMRKPRKSINDPYPLPVKKVDKSLERIYVDQLISVIDEQVLPPL